MPIRLRRDWWQGGYRAGMGDAGAVEPSAQRKAAIGLVSVVGALVGAGLLFGSFVNAGARGGKRALAVRLNPSDRRGVAKAREFRESFTWGNKAKSVKATHVSKAPRHLVKLGQLESVTYSADKKGDGFSHYVHEFGQERGRNARRKKPVLAMDIANHRLHVIGGSYTVTDRGIEG